MSEPWSLPVIIIVAVCSTLILLGSPKLRRRARVLLALLLGGDPDQAGAAD